MDQNVRHEDEQLVEVHPSQIMFKKNYIGFNCCMNVNLIFSFSFIHPMKYRRKN